MEETYIYWSEDGGFWHVKASDVSEASDKAAINAGTPYGVTVLGTVAEFKENVRIILEEVEEKILGSECPKCQQPLKESICTVCGWPESGDDK